MWIRIELPLLFKKKSATEINVVVNRYINNLVKVYNGYAISPQLKVI